MRLKSLLERDRDAAAFFKSLPKTVQSELRKRGENIVSLAALREYAIDVTNEMEATGGNHFISKNGIPLDPELAAEWTREHQV